MHTEQEIRTVPFLPADVILPETGLYKWAVIACDQFTSDEGYWKDVESVVGDAPSSLRMILPEIYLKNGDAELRQKAISESMRRFLAEGRYRLYPDSMFYIERTQPDGRVRHGLLGAIDLEAYDFRKSAQTAVRATEETVVDRLPPRVRIRSGASIELPHILLLLNDSSRRMVYPLSRKKDDFEKVYDFDLMLGGGHIAAWRLDKESVGKVLAVEKEMTEQTPEEPLLLVGDGNHSVATAKLCYEQIKSEIGEEKAKRHPARYALVELVNIHDPALDFESIYRVVFRCVPSELISDLKKAFVSPENNASFSVVFGGNRETVGVTLGKGELVVSKLQPFLDEWLASHPESHIDYVHEERNVVSLARNAGTVGFLFDCISKNDLFSAVGRCGSLPRKTFSMGVSRDKRYYLEARKIVPDTINI